MLNIGRMAPGRADYYLTAVARGDDGVEGYYLARGEEPGRWLGHGADTLGLLGEVTSEQLRAVLDARDPSTGEQLAGHPARKVPGFDHTFRAPKSVSLLWALGDQATAAEVVAAHDAAVDAAIGYLQRAAGFTRRGAGGVETVPVDGFVAAAFRHRTSRADDPLLHTHVLVVNLARTSDDGMWRTLDSRKLFAHAKTAGVLYQAQLRHELTRRLGVAWGPVANGHADIDGVDRQLIETFSQRRAQIVELMASRRETSAAAAQAATLASRTAKTTHPSEGELRDGWSRRAREVGVRPGWHQQLVGRTSWKRPDLGALWDQLVVHEELTESSSSFTRRDLLQQLAGRLQNGAPVPYIEQAGDAILTHDTDLLVALGPTHGHLTAVDVIRRVDGRIVPVAADERRYTTKGLLLTEQRAINRALTRTDESLAVAAPSGLDRAVRLRTLSAEQETMVRRLTTSGAGVEVVVGKAGTGKTYALDAGGLFRALATRLPAVELTDNGRQQLQWEQTALDELRHDNPDTALTTYRQHGRIHTADTAEQIRGHLVDDWWTTARDDLHGSIMIALRRHDFADLNHQALTKMLAAGRLTGPALDIDGLELRAGDRIVCLRNNRRLGVINGTRATITRIDVIRRTVQAVDDRGAQLALPADYLDAGHVSHGYAITGHKAQGLTREHTYTLGTETLYREWGYVAMSRGRLSNQLYHGPSATADDGLHHHVHLDDQTPELTSRLRRSRAEEPITPEVAQLASTWRFSLRYLDSSAVQQQPHVHAEHRRICQERAAVVRRIDDLERRRPAPSAPPSDAALESSVPH